MKQLICKFKKLTRVMAMFDIMNVQTEESNTSPTIQPHDTVAAG